MGFKFGLVVGLAAGYVLGARAGRERYEELKASWEQFMGNPSVQSVVHKGREAASSGADAGIRAVGKATDTVKDKLEGREAGTS